MLPLVFTSSSLGGRQKELNDAVNKTKSWNVESSINHQQDPDVLYKIDLASKFKNIKFLTEILKSGDSLYISRVLKHTWIYNNSDIINPEYLHIELFPFMSEKMKNKMLTAISINVNDEERVQEFCNYCFKNNKKDLGYKFLVYTPVLFKIEMIKKVGLKYDLDYLKNLVGNSLVVADFCFENHRWSSPLSTLHLYSVSPYKYLNLFEKYESSDRSSSGNKKIGLRISKDILKNHKDRVLTNPSLYLRFLNFKTVYKNINSDETKEIFENILPNEIEKFWFRCADSIIFKELIKKISPEDRFQFIKVIFCKKYVGAPFEMDERFYNVRLFESMTKDQRKDWALQNIALDNGFFGDKNNYIWYKFLPFDDSFKIIKAVIHKTTEKHRRMYLLMMLLEIASNEIEIEMLLNYFYKRHVNEQFKNKFIEKVVDNYNILSFNKNLWEVLNKLFLVVEESRKCKTAAVLYCFLHDTPLSVSLKAFIKDLNFDLTYLKETIKKCESNKEKVTNQIINETMKILSAYENEEYEKKLVRCVLYKVISIFKVLEVQVATNDLIMKYARLDKENFPEIFPIEEEKIEDPLRLLKKEITFANKNIEVIYKTFARTENQVRINKFLRKLRIYFGSNGSKELINYYKNILVNKDSNNNAINDAIYGTFALGDWDQITYLINKYVPESDRIKEFDTNDNVEHVQTAICKFIGYCRPPIPLNMIMPYIRGDYVKFCLPMLEILSANLPSPLCIQFIELLLQKPVSVNKHGLRLAFKKFDSQTLIKIVTSSWKNTKSVSLKQVIFVSLYKHIGKEKDADIKKDLIDILKNLMASLSKDECNEQITVCFNGNNIPDELKGEFYDCAYKIVEKLKNNEGINTVVINITTYIHLIGEDLLSYILKDLIDASSSDFLKHAKDEQNHKFWVLLANYLVKIPNEIIVEQRVEDLKTITLRLIESWNYIYNDVYIIRKLASDFFKQIASESIAGYLSNEQTVLAVAPVTTLLQMLTSSLPLSHIYLHLWRLNLSVIIQETVQLYRKKSEYNMPVAGNIVLPTGILMILDIGRRLGLLVKQFVEKDHFFISYLSEKERIINDVISSVHHSINEGKNFEDSLIFLCSGLIETDIVENYMLALAIMPVYYSDEVYETQYKEVLKKIESNENNHLQCMVLQKLYPNFKKAKYY